MAEFASIMPQSALSILVLEVSIGKYINGHLIMIPGSRPNNRQVPCVPNYLIRKLLKPARESFNPEAGSPQVGLILQVACVKEEVIINVYVSDNYYTELRNVLLIYS